MSQMMRVGLMLTLLAHPVMAADPWVPNGRQAPDGHTYPGPSYPRENPYLSDVVRPGDRDDARSRDCRYTNRPPRDCVEHVPVVPRENRRHWEQ